MLAGTGSTVTAATTSFCAGSGADRLRGGPGDDRIYGGEHKSEDRIQYDTAGHGISGDLATGRTRGQGHDALVGFEELLGSPHGDTLTVGGGISIVDGGAGSDRLTCDRCILDGGPGDDRLTGSAIHGGPGDDQLTGTNRRDAMGGDRGNDTIRTGKGDDSIYPDRGADTWDGGPGADTLYGKWDRPPAGRMTVDLDTGEVHGFGADMIAGLENVVGTGRSDVIRGTDGSNRLIGLGGDDVVIGRGGADLLTGGTGDDKVAAGAGDDRIELHNDHYYGLGADDYAGGIGIDTIDISDAQAGRLFVVDLAAGTFTGDGDDTLVGLEVVIGSDARDVIRGDDRPNRLVGASGNDSLGGRAGDDILDGNGGSDEADGGDGIDTCLAETVANCEGQQRPAQSVSSSSSRRR